MIRSIAQVRSSQAARNQDGIQEPGRRADYRWPHLGRSLKTWGTAPHSHVVVIFGLTDTGMLVNHPEPLGIGAEDWKSWGSIKKHLDGGPCDVAREWQQLAASWPVRQRKATMALAPRSVQNMPECLRRDPIGAKFTDDVLDPALIKLLDQFLGPALTLLLVSGKHLRGYIPEMLAGVPDGDNLDRTGKMLVRRYSRSNSAPSPTVRSLLVTNHAGATWGSRNGNLRALTVYSLAFGASAMYAAISSGVFKSIDSGANWTQISATAKASIRVLVDPRTTSTLYALYGDYFMTQVAKSVDAGATGQDLTGLLPPPKNPTLAHSFGDLAIDLQHPDALWLTDLANESPAVYKSVGLAPPTYAGLAPGFAGLYRVNVRMADSVSPGRKLLCLGVLGVYSNWVPLLVK